MKKLTLLALGLGAALTAAAAVETTPFEQVDVPEGSHHPVLAPDGSRLLFSKANHYGLQCMNLSNGMLMTIDESAAAGFQPIFTTDGSTIYYRTAEIRKGLTYRDVRSFSFADGRSHQIEPMSRTQVNIHSMAHKTYANAEYQTIRVCVDGVDKQISPVADSYSYLWASISPDGSKLLFCEPQKGVFVSNLDGTDARRIMAKGDFPSWVDNETVVAVVSHDDGYVILDSHLVAVDITNDETTILTPDSVLVSEATAGAGRVVFTTLEGLMYTFNLTNIR